MCYLNPGGYFILKIFVLASGVRVRRFPACNLSPAHPSPATSLWKSPRGIRIAQVVSKQTVSAIPKSLSQARGKFTQNTKNEFYFKSK